MGWAVIPDALRAPCTPSSPLPCCTMSLPDNIWPLLVEQVKENRALVTSVISYCGPTINKSAKVTTESSHMP